MQFSYEKDKIHRYLHCQKHNFYATGLPLYLTVVFFMEKISSIYQIQSKIKPERIYIGSAVNIKHRWGIHLSDLIL
jgi:hypothetical protein